MVNFLNTKKAESSHKLFDVRLSVDLFTSSMRYTHNADEILEDSLAYIYQDTATLEYDTLRLGYTTDFTSQHYNLHFGFVGLENFYAYAKFPIVHTSIVEKFKYDTTIISRYERNNKSKTYLEGLHLDAGYTFRTNFMNASLVGGLFVPFYKYHDWTAETDSILNGRSIELGKTLQAKIGTIFDVNLKPLHLQLGGIYNHRAGDFTDQLHFSFLLGLSSVESTDFYAELKYKHSLGDYKDSYQVGFWREPLWSKSADVGVGFKMFFTDKFYIDAGYFIRVWAQNATALRNVNINLGYLF